MGECARCRVDLLHCHGTLVRHDDSGWECSAEGCQGDPVSHDFVLDCRDAWAACACGGSRPLGEALAGVA